jgi:hypothetical protein
MSVSTTPKMHKPNDFPVPDRHYQPALLRRLYQRRCRHKAKLVAVAVSNRFDRWHIIRRRKPHHHIHHPTAPAPLPLRGRQPDSTFALNCSHSDSDTNTLLLSLRQRQYRRTHSQTVQ